jgi:hypothetical protein
MVILFNQDSFIHSNSTYKESIAISWSLQRLLTLPGNNFLDFHVAFTFDFPLV